MALFPWDITPSRLKEKQYLGSKQLYHIWVVPKCQLCVSLFQISFDRRVINFPKAFPWLLLMLPKHAINTVWWIITEILSEQGGIAFCRWIDEMIKKMRKKKSLDPRKPGRNNYIPSEYLALLIFSMSKKSSYWWLLSTQLSNLNMHVCFSYTFVIKMQLKLHHILH